MQEILYKVPGGKMLRVFFEQESGKLKKIRITGDFFLHPEEHLPKLEEALRGASLEEQALQKCLADFLSKYPTEIYGFAAADLIKILLDAGK